MGSGGQEDTGGNQKFTMATKGGTILCMNDVQRVLGELKGKGWTLAAIADELSVAANTVVRWNSGDRYPANSSGVKVILGQLKLRRRIPKRKRYTKKSPGHE